MSLEGPMPSSAGHLPSPFTNPQDMASISGPDGLSSPFGSLDGHRLSSHPVALGLLSPSDIVGPSPVTSNGTETTEIEDDVSDEVHLAHTADAVVTRRSEVGRASRTVSTSYTTVPPISTDVNPVRYSVDSATPRAQDVQDMLTGDEGRPRSRSVSASGLEKIDEQTEAEGEDDEDENEYSAMAGLRQAQAHDEITALRTALHECWTLCNTLANLSSIHRTRVFNSSGTPDAHEKAWKTCWQLCQRLYNNQDDDAGSLQVRVNLDLCRDFCQALFDIRQRKHETDDSVLRVSFELNNHLYSAQDRRNLPEAFRERTLDFYITLCHRLMKQRNELAEETDQLLSACWTLAEMLFSLRQRKRDDRSPDHELLGSAVQACWDLCDIFRDGWTQIRPDRNTPRPSQASFFSQQPTDLTGRESQQSSRSSMHSKRESVKSSHDERQPNPAPVPETPVTEFEDTPISPESRSPQAPNIMVLGDSGRGGRWSSNASNMSSYSRSTNRTSSTATTTAASEDPNVSRSRLLVLRAAMNLGFDRDAMTDPKAGAASLQTFVQALPASSFGTLPSHAALLQQYKSSVLTDAFIPRNHPTPTRGKRVSARDMAQSVHAMSNSSSRYAYLRELFHFVFKFPLDEVESRGNVSIVV
ncbi:hypothetical protein DCS_06626 [Drechmeria coniospora]|uniref:DUF7624 domain-containing protein n=1 Tax=Drechmeria coniospora TaxID=98403 RepID=A0A151GC19_DRECN|nr:hypothetical protein DCS_06626 [Drechmeria coniospora]KYK54666.1 hypothetical protein DCS_06626 [Drechmeria coniospora]